MLFGQKWLDLSMPLTIKPNFITNNHDIKINITHPHLPHSPHLLPHQIRPPARSHTAPSALILPQSLHKSQGIRVTECQHKHEMFFDLEMEGKRC